MRKAKWPSVTLACVLLAALLAGFAYFVGLQSPESYPQMSSLNSGPKGSKLLFDALNRMPAMAVTRNYLPFSRWRPASSTILLLSVSPSTLTYASKQDLVEVEAFAQANSRVVIGVPDDSPAASLNEKNPPLIKKRWGIQISATKDTKQVVLDYDSSWQPANGLNEAVEKRFGAGGSVVIAMHSNNFSNEHLATNASFLEQVPALIGAHTDVIFDETHLGIEESGSIAGLARRYRLQGLIAGLLVLVALFIWNRSVSFPPPTQFEIHQDQKVLGADAGSTFAGLIARHLTPEALLENCVAEWNRVKPRQHIAAELNSKIDPVAAYRQLQENLPKQRSRT
jgi:hypothetical protein